MNRVANAQQVGIFTNSLISLLSFPPCTIRLAMIEPWGVWYDSNSIVATFKQSQKGPTHDDNVCKQGSQRISDGHKGARASCVNILPLLRLKSLESLVREKEKNTGSSNLSVGTSKDQVGTRFRLGWDKDGTRLGPGAQNIGCFHFGPNRSGGDVVSKSFH